MSDQLRLAGCIIPDAHGRILLLHRIKRNHWEIPGGKIDEIVDGKIVRSGHSAEHTAEREIKEELNVSVDIVRKLGDREFTDNNGFVCHYSWYLARIKAGTPSGGEPDRFDDLRAFSQAELQAMRAELSSNTRNFLDGLAGENSLSNKAYLNVINVTAKRFCGRYTPWPN